MLEQEGVHSTQKDYEAMVGDECLNTSKSKHQRSNSHELISSLSEQIILSPYFTYSFSLSRRAQKFSSSQSLESTLDPKILREKIARQPVNGIQNNEGQKFNIFKWINKKKKKNVKPPPPQIDDDETIERTSSSSSFGEYWVENEQAVDIQHTPHEFREMLQYIDVIMNHLSPKVKSLHKEKWITHLAAICTEHPKSAKSLVGKVIYVLDSLPETFCQKLNTLDHKSLITWVKSTYSQRISLIKKQISQIAQDHEITGVQSSKHVQQVKLPFAIAQTLVTSEGYINHAICSSLIRHLLPPKGRRLPFQMDIFRVLSLIKRSPKIREMLSEINLPECQYSLANYLIRVQMGVNLSDPIYKRDAIVTALTACLSHLRQGPTGSCFATHFAIVLLSSHIEQCIKDFQMLLQESKLTRVVKGVKKDFPFLLMMSSPSSPVELTISSESQIVTDSNLVTHLWDSPGIQAACQSIKINDPKQAITSVIADYFNEHAPESKEVKMSVQGVLSLLCDFQIKKYRLLPSKKMKLYSLAHFAYASQARNGLLSVWENSIAEMAEGKEGSMIMPSLLHSILDPLITMIAKLHHLEEIPKKIVDKIQLALSHELQKRIHLHYDPDIFNDSIDSEHMSSEGGYVIYDTLHEVYPNLWERIDTPERYVHFVSKIFIKSIPQISEILNTSDLVEYDLGALKDLTRQINTKEFAYQSMISFYPSYKHEKNLLENWNKYKYTPWRTLSGNLAAKVREVYMEDDGPANKKIIKPNNAYDLLVELLNEVKQMPNEEREAYLRNPSKKVPIFTPTHAFSLMLGHPSLQQFVSSKVATREWIKKHLETPCKKYIEQPVDNETSEHLISFVTNELISPSKKKEFDEAARLLPRNMQYVKFRNCVLKLIDIIDTNAQMKRKRAERFDTELCNSLPTEVLKGLSSNAIRFADTNWSEGLHDIHLCITLNPCTGRLSVMQTPDSGFSLKPVKEQWLFNHSWEFTADSLITLPKSDT